MGTFPTFIDASTGAVDIGGAWSFTCQTPVAAGYFFLVHIYQDGNTTGSVSIFNVTGTNIESESGVANLWTDSYGYYLSDPQVADPLGGNNYYHRFLWGWSTSTSAPTISGDNTTSDDLFFRSYQFTNVRRGGINAPVLGLVSGLYQHTSGLSGTISHLNLTLAPNMVGNSLFVSLVAITDDNAVSAFTGANLTWTEPVAEFASATGTDGCIQIQLAEGTTATISGGTTSNPDPTDGWGWVGTGLRGKVSEPPNAIAYKAKKIVTLI